MFSVKLGDGVARLTPAAKMHIANLILDVVQSCGHPIGKVVINRTELTFYKFGLKTGRVRFENSNLQCSYAVVDYVGEFPPYIHDMTIFNLVDCAK